MQNDSIQSDLNESSHLISDEIARLPSSHAAVFHPLNFVICLINFLLQPGCASCCGGLITWYSTSYYLIQYQFDIDFGYI
jgi:hypothetical protein